MLHDFQPGSTGTASHPNRVRGRRVPTKENDALTAVGVLTSGKKSHSSFINVYVLDTFRN